MRYLFVISFLVNLILAGIGYVYYTQTQSKIEEQAQKLAVYKVAQQEQEKTIEALQTNLAVTTESLNNMSKRNAEIEAEKERYLAIFSKHDLTKLATAKPGLIEKRFNKGTDDVFKSIEADTAVIDSLDN